MPYGSAAETRCLWPTRSAKLDWLSLAAGALSLAAVGGSATAVLGMMLYGAAGFYLGIDLPPAPPDHRMHLPMQHGLGSRWDAVELLSAAGTFLAAVAAVVSVSSIVLDETAHVTTALLISLAWAIGATMQIVAGIIARMRSDDSAAS